MLFAERLKCGKAHTDAVREWFTSRGVDVQENGQEKRFVKDFHRGLVAAGFDPTSLMLRYEPDLVLYIVPSLRTHFCECKGGTGLKKDGSRYPYLTYELASLVVGRIRARSASVFAVFGNWTAGWVKDLRPPVIHFDPRRYTGVEMENVLRNLQPLCGEEGLFPDAEIRREDLHGSKTPMALIPVGQLRPLEDFARDELGLWPAGAEKTSEPRREWQWPGGRVWSEPDMVKTTALPGKHPAGATYWRYVGDTDWKPVV
jgi:hypothetical protein